VFRVVGKAHEPGEALTQADGIDDGESDLAGGDRGEEAEYDRSVPAAWLGLIAGARISEQRSGKEERGEIELERSRRVHHLGTRACRMLTDNAEADAGRHSFGGGEVFPEGRCQEKVLDFGGFAVEGVDRRSDLAQRSVI
jgi:hypothetical protein